MPPQTQVTVLGRDRIDLFSFKKADKRYLKGREAGPRLLHKFLLEESCGEVEAEFLDVDLKKNDTISRFCIIDLELVNDKYEVHPEQPFDIIISQSSITVDISNDEELEKNENQPERRDSGIGGQEPLTVRDGPQVEIPSNREIPDSAIKISSQFLVIDDPEGEILANQESRDLLHRCASSYVFYHTGSLQHIRTADNQPTNISSVKSDNLKYLFIIIDVADLRAKGISISRNLSWEKAAADTVELFKPGKILQDTNAKIQWIIRFGSFGAVVLQEDSKKSNQLYFDPENGEGDVTRPYSIPSPTLKAAFMSGLVSNTVAQLKGRDPNHLVSVNLDLKHAILKDLYNVRSLSDQGFPASKNSEDWEPRYPKLEPTAPGNGLKLEYSAIPSKGTELEEWSILKDRVELNAAPGPDLEKKMFEFAAEIVKNGITRKLESVPIVWFGDIVVVDRSGIENFRRIANQVEEYLKEKRKKPLSIGVFGAPGSGKSFSIKQIIRKVTRKKSNEWSSEDHGQSGKQSDKNNKPKKKPEKEPEKYPEVSYNLSQFLDYSNLLVAFQKVRDSIVSGQIPIVFFDEFDTTLNGELGWLKFFLAPMQDGEFFDHGDIRPIGQAVFIFIGGTARTYKEFIDDKIQLIPSGSTTDYSLLAQREVAQQVVKETEQKAPQRQGQDRRPSNDSNASTESSIEMTLKDLENAKAIKAARAVKKPDFVGRLSDHLDIPGYNKLSKNDFIYMIRRAIIIRTKLDELTGVSGVEPAVLNGLLKVNKYYHGARSIETILQKSTKTWETIHRNALPPDDQLNQNLEVGDFNRLVNEYLNSSGGTRTFTFKWPHYANKVYVTGTFNDWGQKVKLDRKDDIFLKTVLLPATADKIQYKFFVDGKWAVDESCSIETDDRNNVNNVHLFKKD